MKFGVVFPQTEIGRDARGVREFATAVEDLGYDHLVIFDHVLGAEPREGRPRGPYTHEMAFHEPFVLFGYLAAITNRIELATGVIILPQRQTALVAKQAAEIDILSGGRLRLGVGTGWNPVEYESLGEEFHTRGRRQVEQVELMRRLWSDSVVDFTGRWHRVDHAGINPRPERTIPVWFGGRDEAVLRRAARLGDGWILNQPPSDELRAALERLRGYLAAAGRDPAGFGIEGFANLGNGDPERWRRQIATWTALGVSHVSINTMGAGLATPADHIEAIRRYRAVLP